MKNIVKVLIVMTPFMLTGCGDGWEMVRVDNIVPYGNSRTAGTGVAYVRAKMMPEKELNLMPVKREFTPRPVVEETVPQPAEQIFHDAQKK
jgi:hypothetical protein